MYGRGSAIEAHNNFGHQASRVHSPVRRPDLQKKLEIYNEYYEGKTQQIRSKEVNGRLVLEGPIRINWGVQTTIKLAEKDESPASKETWRRSYTIAMANGLGDDFLQRQANGVDQRPRRSSLQETFEELDISHEEDESINIAEVKTPTKFNPVIIRGENKRRRGKQRRLSIINGHIFNAETSIFTPAHGSVTSVTVSSLDSVSNVIKQLLIKYKVENNPDDFCLCIVKSSGETRVLKEDDLPLLQRVMLGPIEDTASLFIMDKGKVYDVDEDVAQFISLPDAVLKGFLEKLREEERKETVMIKLKYHQLKKRIAERLSEFTSTNL